MRRMRSVVGAFLLMGLSLAGLGALFSCRTAPAPPASPAANAVLSEASPGRSTDYEAAVLVYVDSVLEYATAQSGNSSLRWYLCSTRPFRKVKGDLGVDRIRFMFRQASAAPQGEALPYTQRMVLLLGLKTAQEPFVIVHEEERSRLPPYGEPARPGALSAATLSKVRTAVLDYVGEAGGPVRVVEETPDCYVAAFDEMSDEPITLTVDKQTFRASLLPSPEPEQPAGAQ
jgi:hypothetical protein